MNLKLQMADYLFGLGKMLRRHGLKPGGPLEVTIGTSQHNATFLHKTIAADALPGDWGKREGVRLDFRLHGIDLRIRAIPELQEDRAVIGHANAVSQALKAEYSRWTVGTLSDKMADDMADAAILAYTKEADLEGSPRPGD